MYKQRERSKELPVTAAVGKSEGKLLSKSKSMKVKSLLNDSVGTEQRFCTCTC